MQFFWKISKSNSYFFRIFALVEDLLDFAYGWLTAPTNKFVGF